MGDLDTKLFERNSEGLFVEYREPYATIECETKEDLQEIQEALRQHKGWIDVNSELRPAAGEYILLSFSNLDRPAVGRYEGNEESGGIFYIADEAETCMSKGLIVNAWMQLPETYRPEVTEGSAVK